MAAAALTFAILLLGIIRLVSSAEPPLSLSSIAVMTREKRESTVNSDIQIVFSDVDGTLVHYPQNVDDQIIDPGNAIIKLPPSSTGMRGIISSETLRQCQALRRRGKKLVLISGMRSTTMWKRLAYLPRADAYCCEAGGRIFYPVPPDNKSSVFKLEPFDGADESELAPFSLEEDMEWRLKMEMTAGVDGFVGNELDDDSSTTPIPIDQRKGPLWEYCRQLHRKGFVVDTTGYSVCFRVNRNQQDVVSRIQFDALSSMTPPEGIATSVNLGCVDFYPHNSGKKNCCQYVARKLCTEETVLGENALCLCDDDNDLEMALACKRAFIPGISSTSMAQIIEQNPIKITVTGGIRDLDEGTSATERALDAVLDMAI